LKKEKNACRKQQDAGGSTVGGKNMARGSYYFILFAIFATITTAKI